MAVTYEYKIYALRVSNEDELMDVVKEMDISVIGTDGECQFSVPATIKLTSPESASFVNFESLTEAEVLTWLESYENSLVPHKAHVETVLAIEVQKNKLTKKHFPWTPVPISSSLITEIPTPPTSSLLPEIPTPPTSSLLPEIPTPPTSSLVLEIPTPPSSSI